MLQRTLLVAFLIFCLFDSSKAQSSLADYTPFWQEIDTLILARKQPKTALEKVNQLYSKTKLEQQSVQTIRCLIYRMYIEDQIHEENLVRSEKTIQAEIASTTDIVAKSMLYSVIAHQYQQYFNQHSWQISKRSKTVGIVKKDFNTWNANDFDSIISYYYTKSIENAPVLQREAVIRYSPLLKKGDDRYLRPTLFDILVHEALDYFKEEADYYVVKPINAFELTATTALSNVNQFIQTKFVSADSTSHLLKTLHLFQRLLAFHANDTEKSAFVDIDLERIVWVKQHLKQSSPNLYIDALQHVTTINANRSAQAYYLLAKYYDAEAQSYRPFTDTAHRYSKVKAMKIISEGLAKYQQFDEGVTNLKNLQQGILRESIAINTEPVNIPNKPFRALVSFKNVDTLYGRIIQLPEKYRLPDYFPVFTKAEFAQMPIVKTFVQPLPNLTDYQVHHVEIKIDALPVGTYALLISGNEKFEDTLNKMGKQILQVSNISYFKNGNDFFVLHRESGMPLANVRATITTSEWNNKKNVSDTVIIANIMSDKNGFFHFEPKKRGQSDFDVVFETENDYLQLKLNSEFNQSNDSEVDDNDSDEKNGNVPREIKIQRKKMSRYEKVNTQVHFFTDRSIYRPGQTVFFKGIVAQKNLTNKEFQVFNKKGPILLYLLKRQRKLKSLYVNTNDFGSFSGHFRLPSDAATGEYYISCIDYQNSTKFSVEEYKVPKFQVSFNSVKGVFQLHDSITMTGIAKAYAGNAIDGAKVRFNVQRSARFVYSWLWNNGDRPNSNSQQITFGETTTDAEGKFSFTFKALSDTTVDASTEPIFDFAIAADVTDNNGETRSAQSQVSIGYKSLQLQLSVPKLIMRDSLKKLTVNTINLNGEKVPANVHFSIYALQGPKRATRSRLWRTPDVYVMKEADFLQYFPNDEYADEFNQAFWPKQLVLQGDLNTANTNDFIIPQNNLKAGIYKIEVTTTDKDGHTIKDVADVQLFDKNAMHLPLYNFSYTVNNQIEPGQTAHFLSATVAEKTFVVQKVSRPPLDGQQRNSYHFLYNKKGFRPITYTANETDRGRVFITEAFIHNNRIYKNEYEVEIPVQNTDLKIRFSSFRNKTEPSSHETWTIDITDFEGKKAVAELLTSMYDASLDQFKVHVWRLPQFKKNIYVRMPTFGSEKVLRINYPYSCISDDYHLYSDFQPNYSELLRSSSLLQSLYYNAYLKPLRIEEDYNQSFQGQVAGVVVQKATGQPGGSVSVQVRGLANVGTSAEPMYIIDGVIVSLNVDNPLSKISPNDILSIEVLKDAEVISKYGHQAANGVVLITTKTGMNKYSAQNPIQPRKNFNETAFFFPHIYADSSGHYSFSFTMPEALTQWKWQTLAHTKDLSFGLASTTITTQKTLMVQPNAPRFVREGDKLELVAKIANLSDKELTGQVRLELLDAATNTPVDGWFQNVFPNQYFTVAAGQSSSVKFPIQIPFSFNKPLTWRVVAQAGNYSDGEENTLPVLSNRMLVTESLPMLMKGNTEQRFVLEKLVNNHSETLTHQSLTVEYTPNPIWTALQALPYLMEYPYECAEQTFNRYFANALAANIVAKHPNIKSAFEQWQKDTTALQSNLAKNEELKQVLLQETPWVLQSASEAQQQKNMAILFDVVKMSNGVQHAIAKLQKMQLSNGAFPWFSGGNEDRYITHYLLSGMGKLKQIGAFNTNDAHKVEALVTKALEYADNELKNDYERLKHNKADLQKQQITSTQIQYLYLRSFFSQPIKATEAYQYYYNQAKQFWNVQNMYHTAMIGLTLYRNNDKHFVNKNILPAILQNAVEDTAKASVYWKDRSIGFWYASPIEHQSMMLQLLEEVAKQENFANLSATIQGAKNWLLLNKQTNHWQTTVATADACYALINNNSALVNNPQVRIQLGNIPVKISASQAGTGYLKATFEGSKVTPQMGNVTITTSTSNLPPTVVQKGAISYGSLYWQYFEDFDKITASTSPLSITKKLFVEKNSAAGKILTPVNDNEELKVGDKVVIQLVLKTDRDMDYVHLKDTRAATMEPVNVLSAYKYQDGLGYYEATKDASTNFFFSHVRKGTYVFDYPVFITHSGKFSIGTASLQCMYAPEFMSHSNGGTLHVIAAQ